MAEQRPDPDDLLRRLAADEGRKRGRLKIFFGASPGVGKTYAMLEAARAKRAEGVDVVIGWIETHGRTETATSWPTPTRRARATRSAGRMLLSCWTRASTSTRP